MPRITVFADTKHLKKRHQNTVLDGYARYEAYCHSWLIVIYVPNQINGKILKQIKNIAKI